MMRMGVLDLTHGFDDTIDFLNEQTVLSEDLVALAEASEAWQDDLPVPVGESGTLYRFLSFAAWKQGIDKKFVTEGTLSDRAITLDPSIVNLSQAELLKLDNETSQWASAAVLMGDRERIIDPPHKLQVTYDAVEHWQSRRAAGQMWLPRRDITTARQADTFQKMLTGEPPTFIPLQAEDYCFAVEFGYITPVEGQRRWPSLAGHESNRPAEMGIAQNQASAGEIVQSRDHRVVQAIAMWGRLMDREVEFEHPDAVKKSWPEFWPFIESTVQ
jgi:hypothetical protein